MLELPTSHHQCWQGEVAPPSPGSSLGLWPPAAGAEGCSVPSLDTGGEGTAQPSPVLSRRAHSSLDSEGTPGFQREGGIKGPLMTQTDLPDHFPGLFTYSYVAGQAPTACPLGRCALTYHAHTGTHSQSETIFMNESRKHNFGTTLVLSPWLL